MTRAIRLLARDREFLLALAIWLALVAASAWYLGLVRIDHVAGHGLTAPTWGVSIGTNTAYCSLELGADAGGAGIDAWCQHAG